MDPTDLLVVCLLPTGVAVGLLAWWRSAKTEAESPSPWWPLAIGLLLGWMLLPERGAIPLTTPLAMPAGLLLLLPLAIALQLWATRECCPWFRWLGTAALLLGITAILKRWAAIAEANQFREAGDQLLAAPLQYVLAAATALAWWAGHQLLHRRQRAEHPRLLAIWWLAVVSLVPPFFITTYQMGNGGGAAVIAAVLWAGMIGARLGGRHPWPVAAELISLPLAVLLAHSLLTWTDEVSWWTMLPVVLAPWPIVLLAGRLPRLAWVVGGLLLLGGLTTPVVRYALPDQPSETTEEGTDEADLYRQYGS